MAFSLGHQANQAHIWGLNQKTGIDRRFIFLSLKHVSLYKICPIIHSTNVLNAFYVPCMILGTGNTAVNKIR